MHALAPVFQCPSVLHMSRKFREARHHKWHIVTTGDQLPLNSLSLLMYIQHIWGSITRFGLESKTIASDHGTCVLHIYGGPWTARLQIRKPCFYFALYAWHSSNSIILRRQMAHFSSQRPDLPEHVEQEPRNPRCNLSEQKWSRCLSPWPHGVNRALFHLRSSWALIQFMFVGS